MPPNERIVIAKTKQRTKLVFVRLTRAEAMRMIEGLARQIITNSPNSGRAEYVWGPWEFSVSVQPESNGA